MLTCIVFVLCDIHQVGQIQNPYLINKGSPSPTIEDEADWMAPLSSFSLISPSREHQNNKMEQIKCPDCGAVVAPEARVCPQCGCQLNKQRNGSNFVSQSLIQGEKILCSAKWHWINYVLFVFLGIISFVSFILWIVNLSDGEEEIAWGVYFPLFIVFALISIYGIVSLKYNEFVVTNKRILIKSGIIRRASYELRLEKLESIQVYQGILGRFLEYGTILVHGVGASRQMVMRLESPLEFRQHIFTELSKQNNQTEE